MSGASIFATFTRQKLSFSMINIKAGGYLFACLSYDDDSNNWVYFDDLKVTHTKTNVIQYNEYYPFGLQAGTSWTRDDSKNNFLYNEGGELNTTTGLYDLFYRNYDPTLGRLNQIDPSVSLSEKSKMCRNNRADGARKLRSATWAIMHSCP